MKNLFFEKKKRMKFLLGGSKHCIDEAAAQTPPKDDPVPGEFKMLVHMFTVKGDAEVEK